VLGGKMAFFFGHFGHRKICPFELKKNLQTEEKKVDVRIFFYFDWINFFHILTPGKFENFNKIYKIFVLETIAKKCIITKNILNRKNGPNDLKLGL
jgi:hypothetical protein